MSMRHKIARLFTIKTRFEAFLVTYAIAVGAVERGIHYMQGYPGYGGVMLALACLGVPFIAGAKLLDSVRPKPEPTVQLQSVSRRRPARRAFSRSRPIADRLIRGSASPSSRRKD